MAGKIVKFIELLQAGKTLQEAQEGSDIKMSTAKIVKKQFDKGTLRLGGKVIEK